MQVLTLHELCRQELIHLLYKRFMPTGWSREGDRKAGRFHAEASRYLDAALAVTGDYLIGRPAGDKITEVLTDAASQRTYEQMVQRMVTLFATLPVPDQAEVYAVAELSDQTRKLSLLTDTLLQTRAKLREMAEVLTGTGISLDDLQVQLSLTLGEVQARQDGVSRALRQSTQAATA